MSKKTEYNRQWMQNYTYPDKEARRIYLQKYYQKHKAYLIPRQRRREHAAYCKRKLIVLAHYSNSPVQCKCCGESEILFLTLDHINGGGTQQRKKIRGIFYRWIIAHGYPTGFRVLCLNCNMGRYLNGGKCPHA